MQFDIEFQEFRTSREAVAHAKATGQRAILMANRKYVVSRADAERLEWLQAAFAYLSEHRGRIVTVPVEPRETDEPQGEPTKRNLPMTGCEFCRQAFNRPFGLFVCPYCRATWGE
jgi:hypothetical protein